MVPGVKAAPAEATVPVTLVEPGCQDAAGDLCATPSEGTVPHFERCRALVGEETPGAPALQGGQRVRNHAPRPGGVEGGERAAGPSGGAGAQGAREAVRNRGRGVRERWVRRRGRDRQREGEAEEGSARGGTACARGRAGCS